MVTDAAGTAGKKKGDKKEKREPKQILLEHAGKLRDQIFKAKLPREHESKLLDDAGKLHDAIKTAVAAK